MKNDRHVQHRRKGAFSQDRRLRAAVGSVVALAVSVLPLTLAGAAGTMPNTISASGTPSAGSDHGTYTPSATASSGDSVVITLDKNSSGCTLNDGKVTFTGSGTCVVDFNDAGNSTYAAATQVSRSITVYAENSITTSAFPSAGSAGGSYAPGANATSGDKVIVTLDKYSTGCSLNSGWVDFSGSGTCKVNFNDPGNGPFAAANQVQESAKVYSANTISVSTPPSAGTIHATYSPFGSATSGDKVEITLNSSSTGCSISDAKVTFTSNGVCVVEFNDPGNGAFAAASEVKQTITVGSGNPVQQGSITITSTSTTFRHLLVLTSVGGSGNGTLSYSVTSPGTADCSINEDILTSERAGTCVITAEKAADGTYAAASSLATTVTIAALSPRATHVTSVVFSGRAITTKIVGSGFYGRPLIVSNLIGVSAVVTHDNGRVLTVRVVGVPGLRSGVFRFIVIFAHGQRTSIRYILR
jgi:hypothetical protein